MASALRSKPPSFMDDLDGFRKRVEEIRKSEGVAALAERARCFGAGTGSITCGLLGCAMHGKCMK